MKIYNRIIPSLLLIEGELYKTTQFKNPRYIGDPINAVKIFNEKEVDELILLDITASQKNEEIQFNLIEDIVSEAFMPVCYGGGIKSTEQIEKLLSIGIEKVSINSHGIDHPDFIREASSLFGSSTIVCSLDVRKKNNEYYVYKNRGEINSNINLLTLSKSFVEMGAGELLITSIDCEGTMNGYDLKMMELITEKLEVPIIANGGAGDIADMIDVIEKVGVSAASAGSIFVYYGKHNAVLINYPSRVNESS
jgi:imidazole glycerol-phosphate synthase subunit HisF